MDLELGVELGLGLGQRWLGRLGKLGCLYWLAGSSIGQI